MKLTSEADRYVYKVMASLPVDVRNRYLNYYFWVPAIWEKDQHSLVEFQYRYYGGRHCCIKDKHKKALLNSLPATPQDYDPPQSICKLHGVGKGQKV